MTDNIHYRGFRWVKNLAGNAGMPEPIRMRVASAYAKSINGGSAIDMNVGDPVRIVGTGTVAIADGGEGASGGETVWGIVVGFGPIWNGTFRQFETKLVNAGGAYGSVLERQTFAWVVPAHRQLWEIDCDDAVTATTEATFYSYIGENCDHVLTTGSEPSSNCMLDISGHGTSSAQWQIRDISPTMANQFFDGNYVKLLVELNEGQLDPYSATGI